METEVRLERERSAKHGNTEMTGFKDVGNGHEWKRGNLDMGNQGVWVITETSCESERELTRRHQRETNLLSRF